MGVVAAATASATTAVVFQMQLPATTMQPSSLYHRHQADTERSDDIAHRSRSVWGCNPVHLGSSDLLNFFRGNEC